MLQAPPGRGVPRLPEGIDTRVPKDPDVHIVMDNSATRRTAQVRAWPARRPRHHAHFTPTPASWINRVERRFAEPARKQLQRGVHASTRQLEADIRTSVKRFRHRVDQTLCGEL